MELQQHAQNETDLAVHVAAQVEVEASYGPVHIAATVGGSMDYSQKQSEDHAYQQSREVVTRAVKRVEETVKTAKATRSLQRSVQKDKHALNNTESTAVLGIYRWVDKVQRLQLFRYPHRFLLEFEIPEPAAYLKWRRSQPRGDFVTPDPGPLVRRDANNAPILVNGQMQPLQPDDITEANYQWWIGQYNVVGVNAPPLPWVPVPTVIALDPDSTKSGGAGGGGGGGGGGQTADTYDASALDKSLFDFLAPGGGGVDQSVVNIPSGYRLNGWSVQSMSSTVHFKWDVNVEGEFDGSLAVVVGKVGSRFPALRGAVSAPGYPYYPLSFTGEMDSSNYPASNPVTGSVQVSAGALALRQARIHVTLNCVLMPSGLAKWQQQTYEQIAAAYWALKRQHADEVAAQETGEGVQIKGDSPERNKEVVLEELKRGVVEMLTGVPFRGRDAMMVVGASAAPQVELDKAIDVAAEIQFIEQAFEWENLTFVLYPYFWAAYERWTEDADVSLADPDFARFLRSGSARVVVPARPNFENAVRTYVDLGLIWGGGPAPSVNDPDYLSVAAEIMAQQTPPDDGVPGKSWEVRLPTTLAARCTVS
ncbi:MAG: hypothetical protein DMF77_17110 [Acidobacteria bacterium]|nr:MAG: hypothetical protein DMF77_17110 [Acidobacteriota bacterium]